MAAGEVKRVFAAEVAELVRLSEDVAAQRMVGENQLLEIVENQFGGTVFVALYLVDDDFHLLLDLRLRENAVEDDVRQQFHGPGEMFFQECAVDDRLLLVCIGVEVAPDVLHAVQDVPGPAFVGAFEDEVFHKVCHTLLVRTFVACAGVDGKSAVGDRGRRGSMDDAQPARQSESVVGHDFCLNLISGCKNTTILFVFP